jgi:polar amino acid transport system substrate-binding protein
LASQQEEGFMLSRKWFRLLWLVAAVAVVLMVFAACGGEEEEGTATATPAATGTAAAGTPAASPAAAAPELQDGVLQIGSDIAYAPIEFYEEGTQNAVGLDIDLANALGEELGVTAEFTNSVFDGLITSLQSQRFDVIMSAMTVTDERSKEIDFIPYFSAGTDILVAAGNPKNIKGVEDLSGLTAAAESGTIQEQQLKTENDDLKAAGKPEINVLIFDQNPLAVEQLGIGRADAVLADSPVVANDARLSDGKLEALGLALESAPYGIGVRKDSSELKAALEGALQKVMESGKYDEILTKWGLESGSIQQ